MARKLRPEETLAFDHATEIARLVADDAIAFLHSRIDVEDEPPDLMRQWDFWVKRSVPGPLDS